MFRSSSRGWRGVSLFLLTVLCIEFLDEFVYGAREAAWPLVREDLGLSYAQIGLLLGLPNIIGSAIEPLLGVLGDIWRRRALVLGGGLFFAVALLVAALSQSFAALFAAFLLFYPASGAFVSLLQASLMDHDPARQEHNMARWTFAGSLGVVAGPLALAAAVRLGGGWRGLYLVFGLLTLVLLALAWRMERGAGDAAVTGMREQKETVPFLPSLAGGLLDAWHAVRRREVLRWVVLLDFSDLMLDVLLGYLALYFVDVAGATPEQAGLAVAVWTGVGLLGDLLLIPVLERMRGLSYLRISVLAELLLFPAFLLAPSFWGKVVLVGLLGLWNSGWYAILQAGLYAALPGRSGTAMAVNSVTGVTGSLIPLALGLIAERVGLAPAMWLLLLGPVVLLFGLRGLPAGADDGERNAG